MVDPIRGGVVYTPGSYTNRKKDNNDLEFSLEQVESNVIKNPDNKERNDDSGLEYRISDEAEKIINSGISKNKDDDIIDNSLYADLKQKIYDLIEYIKSFADRIWNGSEKKQNAQSVTSQDDNTAADIKSENLNIESILKRKDINMLEAYVTDNGNKKPANNTDLLTKYDKNGKLIELEPSERHAIMHSRTRDTSV